MVGKFWPNIPVVERPVGWSLEGCWWVVDEVVVGMEVVVQKKKRKKGRGEMFGRNKTILRSSAVMSSITR